jgi:hypothetical protein
MDLMQRELSAVQTARTVAALGSNSHHRRQKRYGDFKFLARESITMRMRLLCRTSAWQANQSSSDGTRRSGRT